MPETILISATLVVILTLLFGLHVFWAFGGSAGKGAGVPTVDGRRLFEPSRAATLAVAIALALAAAVAGLLSVAFGPSKYHNLIRVAAAVIGLIFAARAVGDGRYVGLLKRVKGTRFARWDTLVYTPLCMLIAAGFLLLAYLNKSG